MVLDFVRLDAILGYQVGTMRWLIEFETKSLRFSGIKISLRRQEPVSLFLY
jgi:hypothetical protein